MSTRRSAAISKGAWTARASAAHLLPDFDQLIEVLWGRRRFRPFHMPPKTSPNRKGD